MIRFFGLLFIAMICLLPAMIPVSDACAGVTKKSDQLLPKDEGKNDPEFLKFRNQLLSAVRSRNAKKLLEVVDKNIQIGFGLKDTGIAAFKKKWTPEKAGSDLWCVLEEVLTQGGGFTDEKHTVFASPYVFAFFPDHLDAYQTGVILGENVMAFVFKDQKSNGIARLSYHLVDVLEWDFCESPCRSRCDGWVKIRLKSGKEGYVQKASIRSPNDYRAIFTRKSGKWVLTILVAGD